MENSNDEGTPLLSSPSQRSESVVSERSSSVRFSDTVAPCASERASSNDSGNSSSNPSTYRILQRRTSSTLYAKLTQSEREQALERPGVGQAAFLIRDAVLGEVENPSEGAYIPYSTNEEFRNVVSIACRRICANRPFRRLVDVVVWLLVLLSLVEPPSWCRWSFDRADALTDDDGIDNDFTTNWHCEQILGRRGPPADDLQSSVDVEYYPNWGMMLVTRYEALMVELACLSLIVVFILLRIGRDGMSFQRYLRKGTSRYPRIAELVAVVCLIIGAVVSLPKQGTNPRHWAPLWRIVILIVFSQDCRVSLWICLTE